MKINIDGHKLMWHQERVGEWKEKGDCFPIYVEIGPTNRCNHRCTFCALDYLEHGAVDINSEVLTKNLEDMAVHGVKSVMFAGEGESLLHKNISDFVRTAKTNGVDVSMTTNGVPLTPRKAEKILPYLSWIRFSIDAGTKETYRQVHGTREEDFERVMANIEYATKLKKERKLEVTIGTQALLIKHNLGELVSLAERLKSIGVDNLQIKPYSHHPLSKNDLSVNPQEAEELRGKLEAVSGDGFKVIYRTKTIERINSGIDYPQCFGLPFFALIDSKGNVIPCNLSYNNPDFIYGNINKDLFSEIWQGKKRQEVISRIQARGTGECRKGCRLDVINRYLHEVKEGRIKLEEPAGEKPAHINFI
jgi:GTP 3',8-cyclase